MIVHLDADAFFASVEQAADPRLRGKAIAVGGQKRGIIASASYEARKLGVYTPMPTAQARRICPSLIVVSGDFEKYEHFSKMMFSYVYDFTPDVEVQGIDEGYFDLKGHRKNSPSVVAASVRKAIHDTLKITVSEGVGANKLVSQIASKLRKPDNLIEVPQGTEREFLAPLPNKWLPSIGPKTGSILDAAGLRTIHQIAGTEPDLLARFVGGYAPTLHQFACGIDNRLVIAEQVDAKSYGEQNTFNEDVTDEAFILATLRSQADRLMVKVRADVKTVRTVTVKIRYNDFQDSTRSQSLEEPTDLENDLYPLLETLLKKAWERRVSLRLVSVKLSGVYSEVFRSELALTPHSATYHVRRDLACAVDRLKEQFGSKIIMRGHDLWLKHQDGKPRKDLYRVSGNSRPTPTIKKAQPASFVALNCKSYYSFMDSLLSPSRIVALAVESGAKAVAMTDPNLHGAVEFIQAAKAAGIRPILAAELQINGQRQNAYVKNRQGYQNLCRLLSQPKLRQTNLDEMGSGLLVVPHRELVTQPCFSEVRYHKPEDRPGYQIVQSIRTLSLLAERCPGKRYGRYHLPAFGEIASDSRGQDSNHLEEILDQCHFTFDFGKLRFPAYNPSDGSSAREMLGRLAHDGLRRRYPKPEEKIQRQLKEELQIIGEVGYEEYFLTVWDLLQECAAKGIEWITRGSAADSLVCFCLGISGVCPIRFDLYFRRFLNRDRMALNKLPDIDLDFAHDRKDDVVDLVFSRFGDSHAAVVGGFSTFQSRSALAEIGKVLGLSEFQVRRITEQMPSVRAGSAGEAIDRSCENQKDVFTEEPAATALKLSALLDGFPRYPKMHPCGVVISRDRILDHTPIFQSNKGYPTTHFDMEAVEAVGLVKLDILAQGGLAVMRDAREQIVAQGIPVDLDALEPWNDPKVWDLISSGNARGVHHIESPAMTTLEKMCNVRDIDVLIAIVSVIRPGAANTHRKADFALRSQGLQEIDYTHPSLEPVLRSTFGVIAYEEHILQIAEAFAAMPAGRADMLRRALVKEKPDNIATLKLEFYQCAVAYGRTREETDQVWGLVEGFIGYAFCRAHSTAYGVEAYQAAWLKCYHPAEFLAGVLSHEKGFYSPLLYTIEARRLGVGFLSPDINESQKLFTVMRMGSESFLRVPLWKVKDVTQTTLANIERERSCRRFVSVADFYLRVSPTLPEMRNLLQTGAFDGFGFSRTKQFWHLHQLAEWPSEGGQGLLFSNQDEALRIPAVELTEPGELDKLQAELDLLGFTVSGHPLDLYPEVDWASYGRIADLSKLPGQTVVICGYSFAHRIAHQKNGELMKFISLCDYSGMVETELFAETYRLFGPETVKSPVVEVEAKVEAFENAKGFTLRVFRVGRPRLGRK